MGQKRVIDEYQRDVGFTVEQLGKLIASYKVLIDAANCVNGITIAKKSDVKDALKRAREVGDIIDEMIAVLDYSICTWGNYMKLKSQYINSRLNLGAIETEIEEEIRLQGP